LLNAYVLHRYQPGPTQQRTRRRLPNPIYQVCANPAQSDSYLVKY
jgi:hypothetical protein